MFVFMVIWFLKFVLMFNLMNEMVFWIDFSMYYNVSMMKLWIVIDIIRDV